MFDQLILGHYTSILLLVHNIEFSCRADSKPQRRLMLYEDSSYQKSMPRTAATIC